MMNFLMLIASNPGLAGIEKSLVQSWIGPALFIVVAFFSIKFIISRQFRELAGFLAISAIVGLIVFNAAGLFGKDGIFYNIVDFFSGKLAGGG